MAQTGVVGRSGESAGSIQAVRCEGFLEDEVATTVQVKIVELCILVRIARITIAREDGGGQISARDAADLVVECPTAIGRPRRERRYPSAPGTWLSRETCGQMLIASIAA